MVCGVGSTSPVTTVVMIFCQSSTDTYLVYGFTNVMEHVRRMSGDSSNPRRIHRWATIGGSAAGVGNTPRLRGDVIGKLYRFSENEFKNERAVLCSS